MSDNTATAASYNPGSYRCPSQKPNKNATVYLFSDNNVITTQRSSMARVKIWDENLIYGPLIC